MHKIYVENPKRISRELKKLQTSLKVKLDIKNKEIILKGKEIDKFIASPIIEAVNKGFDTDTALLLRDENYIFECINIKALTRRTDLYQVRARIIGKKGKTLRVLNDLTDCNIILHENQVFIIGPSEKIKDAINGLRKLIQGSKQSSTYSYLERARKNIHPPDLGLKSQNSSKS